MFASVVCEDIKHITDLLAQQAHVHLRTIVATFGLFHISKDMLCGKKTRQDG